MALGIFIGQIYLICKPSHAILLPKVVFTENILPHLCGMNAEIITIGDELLIGQVIDTNSSWMAQRLNEAGVRVVRKQTVGDLPEQMAEVIKAALNRSDIVLLTGGLGPTKDDKTRDVLCAIYDCGLVVDGQTLARMEAYFTARNRVLIDTNRDQANVPDKCTPIPNHHGTAPGMWFDENGRSWYQCPECLMK